MKRKSEVFLAIQRELNRYAIAYQLHRLGKHYRMEWIANGQKQSYVFTTNATDVRAPLNARSDVRRKLRAAGVANDVGA